jgi:hypothetical protein
LDVPPAFWEHYASGYGSLNEYYVGPYHPKKCQKFIEIAGIKDENWRVEYTIDLNIYIKETRKWFRDHEVKDENGNRLYFEQQY